MSTDRRGMSCTNRLIAVPPFIAKISLAKTSGATASSRRTVWAYLLSMGVQAQQGAVGKPAHPAFVAAGAQRGSGQQIVGIHHAGLARPGEEQAQGLHARAAGQQFLAWRTQAIEDVAHFFEALPDTGFVQQLQHDALRSG